MSKEKSAGVLLWRDNNGEIEVLIVHPSGKQEKPWSIPKGNPNKNESLEKAARRETLEEASVEVKIPLIDLGSVKYKSGKKVYCFAGRMDDAKPKVNSWEIDKAEFFSLKKAQTLLQKDQRQFIDRLKNLFTS